MPSNLVKTKEDEKDWERAKKIAAKHDHEENWRYITSVFKRLKKGRKKREKLLEKKAAIRSRPPEKRPVIRRKYSSHEYDVE